MNLQRCCILLLTALLTGCVTSSKNSSTEEFILPELQQNTYLSHSKPPQHFGFSAYPIKDGIGIDGRARLHANQLATSILSKGNLPIIDVRGRSPRMKMKALLDPSSPSSWLEFNASQEFNAIFLGMDDTKAPYRGGYNTGNVPAYSAVVTQLRIDQLFMENVPLYIRMAMNTLGPLARGIQAPSVDAVLGYDLLQTFEYVQYDFDSGVIKFSSSIPYLPHQNLLMTTAKIVKQRNFGLAVEGAVYGQPSPIILDFAGEYHFARGDVKVSMTKQVSLGDVVYRKVPTLLLPVNSSPPRAGRKMLEKYIITVCHRAGVVYFERIPE